MNFEPQKFFIDLMDFFSILLPGALLTFLLMDVAGPVVLGDRYEKLAGAEAWTAFLFASYLLGHIVFLLGSWLDEIYDWARRYTLNTQIRLLARRDRLLSWPARALIRLVFKHERNLAVEQAGKIKKQILGRLQAKNAINTFQWCKALLKIESPESLAVVQRFEADSKFFRCFTVVLLLLLATWPPHPLPNGKHAWTLAGIPVVLGLVILSLWRYMEQRLKATNQAYWSVITLTAKNGSLRLGKEGQGAANPTRVGGVVFRIRDGKAEYLLVEAKDDPAQWVLPKGIVENGEKHQETAVREVHEETGVWARIGIYQPRPSKISEEEWLEMIAKRRLAADLGNVSYTVNGAVVTVRFYLMQAVGRGLRKEKERRHAWLTLENAIKRASHNETRELLQSAELQRMRTLPAE
jgi:8-oxo-dGTP pyrophosphatase MutT (NUDIX family)